MASVIESFIYLFTADTSGLQKGAVDAKKTTEAVNNSLQTTDSLATKIGGSFQNLARQYGGLILSALSVGGLVRGINNAANFADRLDELSKALNVSVEQLSVWGDAVKLNGGTAESFQETVKFMTASLSDFATKGTSRAAPFFESLGIAMTDANGRARSFFEILPEISDAFQHLSKAESFGIGQKLGLDQGTIMLLQQGRKELDAIIARQKELGVVTKQDAEIAAKFNDAWDDTAHAFRSLFVAVGSSVLPAFTAILKIMEKVVLFLKENSLLVKGVLIALGTAILVFVVPPLLKAAASALILYAPFILIGAAVAALSIAFGLLYDDLMNFFQGNNSVTGELVKRWPILGDIIYGLVDAFKGAWEMAKNLFGFLSEAVMGLGQIFESILTGIWDAIKAVISGVTGAIDTVTDAYDAVKDFLGLGNSAHTINVAQSALTAANQSPLTSQTSNSIMTRNNNNSNRTNNFQTGNILINTQATDANGIAGALDLSLKKQMRQTVNSFDDGVSA